MRQRIHRYMVFSVVALLLGANLALSAQGGVQATFTFDITCRHSMRALPPAQVTNENENVLKSKGYAKIGTIIATKGIEADPEITERLQSAILQKAARTPAAMPFFLPEQVN